MVLPPKVSVIMPCRNEASHITACLQSLLAQQPPGGGMEFIVADGMSDDGTRAILEQFAAQHPALHVLDNPARRTPCGLNLAVRAAQGEIIVRMDAHTEYAPDYVVECMRTLERTQADNVGGAVQTKTAGYLQRAVAAAYHCPLVVGGARFHKIAHEGFVDTVPYGCWRRSAFEKFGFFDEELVRNEDDEFNLRIVLQGGKIWQSATIKSHYYPRDSLPSLFRQYSQYGYWKVRVIQKHRQPASLRHLVPGTFLLAFVALAVLALFSKLAYGAWEATALTYALVVGAAALDSGRRGGLGLLPVLPAVIVCYQVSYGYGFLRGVFDFVICGRTNSTAFTSLSRGHHAVPASLLGRNETGSTAANAASESPLHLCGTGLPAPRRMGAKPAVSVILPCYNEVQHITDCIRSVLAQDPPAGGMELIVADGMSDDGTRGILEQFATQHPFLHVIDNPARTTSCGLNLALRAAQGEIIIRIDAHTEYASDYVCQCVSALAQTGADNVGGPARTKPGSTLECAIVEAFHSPFSVGGARFHKVNFEGYVDTVTYGCWRRSTFDKFGAFDEELIRNQDDEHNLRIIRSGGSIYQSPKIKSWYQPRSNLKALACQYKQYGYWKVRVIQKHKCIAAWRHLVPVAFLIAMGGLALVSVVGALLSVGGSGFSPLACFGGAGFLILATAYLLAVLGASLWTAAGDGWRLLPLLPAVFACYHFAYGYGFLLGIRDFVIRRKAPGKSFVMLTRKSENPKESSS